jgi:hypothetical protein
VPLKNGGSSAHNWNASRRHTRSQQRIASELPADFTLDMQCVRPFHEDIARLRSSESIRRHISCGSVGVQCAQQHHSGPPRGQYAYAAFIALLFALILMRWIGYARRR